MSNEKGHLYLIPTGLGETNYSAFLAEETKQIIGSLDEFIAEKERTARRFLKNMSLQHTQDELTFHILNKHTSIHELPSFIANTSQGKNIGLLSEAGCPGVADPGADVVKLAHKNGIKVIPLVGPSSILLALMASGLNGQQFAFVGYLPREALDRKKRIRELEQLSSRLQQTQIFIETPYRNRHLLEDLVSACHPDTQLCIAVDITLPNEEINTLPIHRWKKKLPDIHKRPAVFLLLAN